METFDVRKSPSPSFFVKHREAFPSGFSATGSGKEGGEEYCTVFHLQGGTKIDQLFSYTSLQKVLTYSFALRTWFSAKKVFCVGEFRPLSSPGSPLHFRQLSESILLHERGSVGLERLCNEKRGKRR